MNTQTFPVAAKSLIETSRSTLVNAIDAGRQGTHRTLETYDKLFKAGTDTIAQVPVALATELRNDLIALECQLNLITTLVAQGVAHQTTEVANRIASTAACTVDGFEQVFDTRVMQSLDRLGVPASDMVRELADRVAAMALQVERLLQAVQAAPTVAKVRSTKTRRPAKRASKRAA